MSRCNQCGNPCNSGCNSTPSCDDGCLGVNEVPGSACTLAFVHQGCATPYNFKPVVQGCETPVQWRLNQGACTLELLNELYLSSNGKEGYIQAIDIHQLGGCIALGDLNNVSENANHPDNCAFLVYKKSAGCGDGCQGSDDAWQPWVPNNNKVDKVTNVIGVNDAGCPVVGPLAFSDYYEEKECTYFDPAPGYVFADNGGNRICYYKNRNVANIELDIWVSAAKPAGVLFNEHVATIHDPRFFPNVGEGYSDLPLHAVWKDNNSGAIMPVWARIDQNGRVLVSGEISARGATGRTRYILLGVDDPISYSPKGL